ncbi:MAG: hypothetical protein IPJ33_13450 [Gammaproteobacteria bacterium]|nr:hypothetical protein [Gammaproteobacteria bacterium]MBK7729458.1 hypothetical protein [Gammaproteobacteria bacterium]
MANSKKLAAAALAGLLGVGVMGAGIAQAAGSGDSMEKSGSIQQQMEKHACKGKNACKGQGADGKNECKGHGSCATDGSKPAE